MAEEVEEDIITLIPMISHITWLRPGVFTVIYNDFESNYRLTIHDLANNKTLYFDN
jgi:hypothetical protein